MTEANGNGTRRLLWKVVNISLVIAASASAGYIAAYERRLASVEALAAATAATQVQRGERFVRAEGQIERHEEMLREVRENLRNIGTAVIDVREIVAQLSATRPAPFRPPGPSERRPPSASPTFPSGGFPAHP